MDIALNECRRVISSLKTGERVTFDRHLIRDVKTNPFTGQSPVDRIVEGLVGSSYNLRHWVDIETGNVTFERVKEDGRKWYEPDPDRRDWYKENPDGSLSPVDCKSR